MNISDLASIKKTLMDNLTNEGEKVQDDYRQGVGTGLTMALMLIDRLMESESEAQERYYDEE